MQDKVIVRNAAGVPTVTAQVFVWELRQGCMPIPHTLEWPGKCWLASLAFNPAAKYGGLERTFWDRAVKGWVKVPVSRLNAGDFLENGTKVSDFNKEYWYYRVLVVAPEKIIVREANKSQLMESYQLPIAAKTELAYELEQLRLHEVEVKPNRILNFD